MGQLNIFDTPDGSVVNETDECITVIVSKDLIPPFESKETLNSTAFNEEREVWRNHVLAVADCYDCSFVEAREMLLESRNKETEINMNIKTLLEPKVEKL